MKLTQHLFFAFASVLVFSACQKEVARNEEPSANKIDVQVIATSDADTRTVLGTDGLSVLWQTSNETLGLLEKSSASKLSQYTSDEGTTTDGVKMSFGLTLNAATGYDSDDQTDTKKYFTYYAVYPGSSLISLNEGYEDAQSVKVALETKQFPTSTSFGQGADVLISKPLTFDTTQPSTIEMQFKRIVAVGKMQIKNVGTSEKVKSVTFQANGKTVSGRSYVNIEDGTVTEYGYTGQSFDNVVLDYSKESIDAANFTAYFTAWPLTISGDDETADNRKFTVTVETESKVFAKTITLATGKTFNLREGRISNFSIDFDGIEGTGKAVDLNEATLTFSEIKSDGASDGSGKWGQYAQLYKYTQNNGATWGIQCYYNDNYIQLGNCTATSGAKNSYIQLPTFTRDILSVKVTLNSNLANGKTLFLASSGSLTEGDIASFTGNGSVKVYTFDLSEKSVKTAFLRTTATAQVTKIEVSISNGDLTPLGIVSGSAEQSGTDFKIDVLWEPVENAESYTVGCGENSETYNHVAGQSSYSHTFTVSAAGKYTVTITANPSEGFIASTLTLSDIDVIDYSTVNPATVSFSDISGSAFTASWEIPENVDMFEYYVTTLAGAAVIGSSEDPEITDGSSVTINSGLSANTDYLFFIRSSAKTGYISPESFASFEVTTLGEGETQQEVTYKFTILPSDFVGGSYAANDNEKTSTAIAVDDASKTKEVKWTSQDVMLSSQMIQFRKSSAGYIYNSTDLGEISSITVNGSSSLTVYKGSEIKPTSAGTGGFFKIVNKTSNAVSVASIEVTFTVIEVVGPPVTWNLTGIEITNEPDKTAYYVGEKFDPTGLEVTASYVDADDPTNTKTVVIRNSDLTFTPDLNTALTASNTSIKIEYEGEEVYQTITVSAEPEYTSPVEFTPNNGGLNVDNGPISMTISGGAHNNSEFRIYKNNTLTLSSSTKTIKKVEFVCTANGTAQYGPGCFIADVGEYTYEASGPNGTWTGSSSSVVFTASTNQVRATSIKVYFE